MGLSPVLRLNIWKMADSGLCGMDLGHNGRSRQGLALRMSSGPGCATGLRHPIRQKGSACDPAERIRLTSTILPKWARRPVSLDGLLPVLYLKGISTGDFRKALSAIIGPDARNMSPSVISRLTAGRQAEYDAWTRRDLSARHSICILSASGRMASVFRLGWQKTLDLCR